MRVALVDNLLFEQRQGGCHFDLQPHLGLLSLASVIEGGGHGCVIYDPKLELAAGRLTLDDLLYRDMADAILEREPDIVGFTSLGCNFICTAKVAARIRALAPDLPLLLGGPHASILDRQVLERLPQFDAIVRGEAEQTILAVVAAAGSGDYAGVTGVTYRTSGGIEATPPTPVLTDLDLLPLPAYEHHPIAQLGLDVLRVEAGRGCPFSCTFCSTASFFGRLYRLKSADRLCREMDELHARYGISHFSLMHDLFTVNKSKVREFCHAVRERGYTWACSARMDCVTSELLEEMSAAGCRSIYYGVETGSPRMQEITRKRLDLSLVPSTLDTTHRLGMAATASFITGYPEEEQADQDETLDLIGALAGEHRDRLQVQLHLLTPEPGTRLIEEFGDGLLYDGHVSDFNFPTLEPDDAEVMRLAPEIFVNHFYYAGQVDRRRHILATSAYAALESLGRPTLVYLLKHYDGRLSRLVAHLHAWAVEHAEDGPYDSAFLCRFVRASWGPGHHLTSLLRYVVAASALRPPPASPSGATATGSHYVLSPAAAVLADLHDCPAMLEAAARGGEIAPPGNDDRRHYLLLLDGDSARRVRNFELDDAALALFDGFREPRTLEDGAEILGSVEPLERLVELGALCQSAKEPATIGG